MATRQSKSEPMGFVCYLLQDDGSAAPFDELTPEQRKAWQSRAAARLSETMGDYYTQHPEEYKRLGNTDCHGRCAPSQ